MEKSEDGDNLLIEGKLNYNSPAGKTHANYYNCTDTWKLCFMILNHITGSTDGGMITWKFPLELD